MSFNDILACLELEPNGCGTILPTIRAATVSLLESYVNIKDTLSTTAVVAQATAVVIRLSIRATIRS